MRIHASGAKVMRTDLHGHITVETDGNTYSVTTEKHVILLIKIREKQEMGKNQKRKS